MITVTLEPQLEQQLNVLASEKGLTTSELIKHLFLGYKLEHSLLGRLRSNSRNRVAPYSNALQIS